MFLNCLKRSSENTVHEQETGVENGADQRNEFKIYRKPIQSHERKYRIEKEPTYLKR